MWTKGHKDMYEYRSEGHGKMFCWIFLNFVSCEWNVWLFLNCLEDFCDLG